MPLSADDKTFLTEFIRGEIDEIRSNFSARFDAIEQRLDTVERQLALQGKQIGELRIDVDQSMILLRGIAGIIIPKTAMTG